MLNNFKKNQLLNIISKYGCPIWVYDSSIIIKKIKLLKKFDIIRFAQKSCSNINILKIMLNAGVKIDAVSLGEIKRALTAGFSSNNNEIIYTSDIFDDDVLKKIVQYNITVNIGSLDMLSQLGSVSSKHNIWLRINPGFGHGHSNKTNTGGKNSKHGIWYQDLTLTKKILKKYNFNLLGLHMHIGSGTDYIHLKKLSNTMVKQAIKFDYDLKFISAGGGLPVPYKNNEEEINTISYYNIWNQARKKISNHLQHNIKLETEPGRFLVAQSGILITQIKAIKFMSSSRHYLLINAGFNDFIRPVLYGSYHKISLLPIDDRKINYKDLTNYIIAGPLCESGDVITQSKNGKLISILLPKNIKINDYLVIHDVGAYGSSMSSNYNSRPLIPEILIEGVHFRKIRRKQKIEELIKLEII